MNSESKAKVWQETVVIPTYGVGEPNKNPMFLEKRVYQGSSGKVYPLPVIDKIIDEKTDKAYTAVFLENEYIHVMVLPELGGRIQRAVDKTNGYDFVYHNEVIKPALVGLVGPWISGGIEFNWPQHHRPTTYMPVDWRIVDHPDGSASVELSEVDQMYGTKGKMTFTVRPGRAYIEISGQLYNRTNLPQTFLWWANPAVAVNDNTQSVFPPDVTAVYDHGKRDVSTFPIATGVYYKHDYGEGVDISRYKNIPVPTSYMCAGSEYDFVGGYDYGVGAGILHIADHHVSPGKKQWTWGCGDFGQAWDRNLTDRNGPYIELMTGMYCDNQPDFTWLNPGEEKTFTQYFMPYKAAGYVKNANRDCAVNLEANGDTAKIVVYATRVYRDARIVLRTADAVLLDRTADVGPQDVYECTVPTDGAKETGLTLVVYAAGGRELIRYAPQEKKIERIPDPMPPAKLPAEIATCEELYLTGLHLEQYRHATFRPEDYYIEAIRRDPGDIRSNNAYGLLLMRSARFEEALARFDAAIARMTSRNPNPYDSEAYLNRGICLRYMDRQDEAYDALFKAAWSAAQQEFAYYHIACIDALRGEFDLALEHVERSLVRNGHSLKARALRGMLLSLLGREEEAESWFAENLVLDAFDYVSGLEAGREEETLALMGGRVSSFIECAIDYAEMGFYKKALDVLALCPANDPMLLYYRAAYSAKRGDAQAEREFAKAAAACCGAYCFPNRLEDAVVLERYAGEGEDARAPYYLGCLLYDRRVYDRAIALWERSGQIDGAFPTVWRNLAIAYFNKRGDAARAMECLERAYELDESDARVLLELDQLRRRLNVPVQARLDFLTDHMNVVNMRDDLCVEYCTLLNTLSRHEEALSLIMARRFHPWEGGEGKVTTQYATALKDMAIAALQNGDAQTAKTLLSRALVFPHNLGEGKLEGAKDNDLYLLLGHASRMLGDEPAANAYFERASQGDSEPVSAMYYNDQPADMIFYRGLAHAQLGRTGRANACFHQLIAYGEKHYYDEPTIDYFAVSLPDLQLFEADLTQVNRVHCEYLIALGSMGLGDHARAKACFAAALSSDCAHQGAVLHALRLNG